MNNCKNNYCFFEPIVFGVLFIDHNIYIAVDSIVRFKERTLNLYEVENKMLHCSVALGT